MIGISGIIIIIFLLAIIFIIVGLLKKNIILKVISAIAFIISAGLFILVWNAMGYM